MQSTPKELLKEYVQSQQFTSTADIMQAMKDMFRDLLEQVMEVEMDDGWGGSDASGQRSRRDRVGITATAIRRRRSRRSWEKWILRAYP